MKSEPNSSLKPENRGENADFAENADFEPWTRLTAVFRKLFAPPDQDDSPPLGFATRVVAQWQVWRKNELFRAWERMSIRTAIACSACAVVFGLFTFAHEQTQRHQELIVAPPTPELEAETTAGKWSGGPRNP